MYYLIEYRDFVNNGKPSHYVIYVTPKEDVLDHVSGRVIAFKDNHSVFKVNEKGFYFDKRVKNTKILFKSVKRKEATERFYLETL